MIWNYKWNKEKTRGIAGVYECDGWNVWNNGDCWKITNECGFTYSRGYKQVGNAVNAAERMMANRKTQDVFVIETNYGYGWEEEYETDSIKDVIARYKEYVDNVVAYKRGLARWRRKRKMVEKSNKKEGAE